MEPGGCFRHSEDFRTIFGADEVLHVLQGTFVIANPETGDVVRAEPGESVFFRRDTWHHGFSYGDEPLRVLEFFAPPPSTGTSGAYAQTRPYLEKSVYAVEDVVGSLADAPSRRGLATGAPRRGQRLAARQRCARRPARLDRDLTAGTVTVPVGRTSLEESHDGEELIYVTRGELRVEADGIAATLAPGDAFFVPSATAHRYAGTGDGVAEAIFGVAPRFGPSSPS